MNKEISKSPKKHEFLLNLAKSPPLSTDHLEYYFSKPHSKDSMNDPDDHLSFHRDVLTTTTEYLSTKNMPTSTNSAQNRRHHLKKKSYDYLKDSVTHNLVSPSSATNSKLMARASQSRAVNKSTTSQNLSFLNSKEFAKFALSKVLPKDLRRDKYITQTSPAKGSKNTSVDKTTSKREDMPVPIKPASLVNAKKSMSKPKGRVSNLTYNEFSSVLDQSRGTTSFMNSPQRRANIQVSLTSTKSTSNLRTPSSKTTHHSSKNSLFQNPLEAYKPIDPTQIKKKQQEIDQYAELPKHKERNKGMQSIASILNLRRDKKFSPDKNVNSWHPACQNHRKIASIANTAHESAYSFNNSSVNHSNFTQNHTSSQFINTQEDRHLLQRSPSNGQKTFSSPSRNTRKTTGHGKKDDPLEEIQEMAAGKDNCMEHFTGLRNTFDNLLARYKGDIEYAQESFQVMKKIKKAYEAFIMELLATQNQVRQANQAILNEEIEFKRRCETLVREKQLLEDQVQNLQAENYKLFNMVNDNRNRAQKEPDSGITMLNNMIKKNTEDLIEDIRMNKNEGPQYSHAHAQHQANNSQHNNSKVKEELETLKKIVISQQNMINDFEGKEHKMARLITAIRKTGFDVDRVIREEFENGSTSDNSLSHSISERENENAIISLQPTEREYEQPEPVNNSNNLEILSLTDGGDFSDLMIDPSEYQAFKQYQQSTAGSFGRTTPLNTVNTMIKNKLKLDFKGLPQNPNKNPQNINMKLPIGHILAHQPDNAEPMGFHDEFMAKIEEFSLSWRQAALNQRNF